MKNTEESLFSSAVESREEKLRIKIREDINKISTLEKALKEYENLDKTLQTLNQKLSHQIMIPFGNVAFMRGKLINTNQITVAIGDDYFIQCSVHHARGIVSRRKITVKENIKKIKEEFDFLKRQTGLAAQLLDFDKKTGDEIVEIKEEYSSDEEIDLKTTIENKPKPKIEVISETVNTNPENDPILKMFQHYSKLEMEGLEEDPEEEQETEKQTKEKITEIPPEKQLEKIIERPPQSEKPTKIEESVDKIHDVVKFNMPQTQETNDNQQPEKKVSRFKAQRAQK